MHKNYYYDGPDGIRARLTDVDTPRAHRTRLVIRADRGQGELLLNRTYTTHDGARRALSRRAQGWTCYRKNTF